MEILMEALRTFVGMEGFKKRGDRFIVTSMERAKSLERSNLAKMVKDTPPPHPIPQEPTQVNAPQEAEENFTMVSEPNEPPQEGEAWGIGNKGGGVYVLPSGETTESFEEAKTMLRIFLESDVGQVRSVSLVEPVKKQIYSQYDPTIVWVDESEEENTPNNQTDTQEPQEIPEENPQESQEEPVEEEPEELPQNEEQDENPPTFEDEVRYIGGGWYELPNGERVQGKKSARESWEKYRNER